MIPPNTTLLKYDNPLLVTKNADKKTPAVRTINSSCLVFSRPRSDGWPRRFQNSNLLNKGLKATYRLLKQWLKVETTNILLTN